MACRWLHRRFDNTVTFHIIFQGQYLPAGFCWDTVAQYYVDMAKKKAITDQPAEAEEKEKEETFLKRLSHRNIAKVGMMTSCHVVCRVRKEGWKGLSGGGSQWADLRNVPF